MKKFYNNTLTRGAFSKALRLVALLCVLMGVSTTAWGAADFQQTDTWNLKYYPGQGGDTWGAGYDVSEDANLGQLTGTPYLKGVWVKTEGGTDITSIDVEYNGKKVTTLTYSGNSGDWNRYWSNENLNESLTNTAGNHSFTLKFSTNTGKFITRTISYTIAGASQTKYSLGGYLNKTDINAYDANYNLVKQNDGTYKGTFSFSQNHEGAQWIWVIDDAGNKWGVSSNQTLNPGSSTDLYKGQTGGKVQAISSTGTNYTFIFNPSNGRLTFNQEGGGGGDDPDPDPSDVPSCDAIEIWCKGEGSYVGMHCYAWHPDNNTDNPLNGWPGSTTSTTGMYGGEQYAVWTVTGKDRLNVIFNNNGDCQTSDILGLEKGNRYIYTLASSLCGTTPTCKVINCGGGGEVDVVNGTVYLDVSSFTDWLKEGAIFKAVLTKKAGGTETKNMIQCANETNVFYVNEVLNLANYSKIQVLRCNPADGGQWNYSSTLNLSTTTTCVKVSGWDNTGSITKYTGSCGVSTDSPVYLTNPAVVGADGRSVTMFAYLSETYCTAITEYGFVYCPGTLSAGCVPTASSPKLVVGSGAQLYRGEAYQLNTSALSMGKTYGYKAYVKIGNMTYLSAETGFFKLTDCNTRPEAGSGTITYTVNAALGEDYEDDCTLTYGNLQTAIDRLKQSYSNPETIYRYVTKSGDSYNLRQPVVVKVHYYDDTPNDDTIDYIYRGTTNIGKHAGNATPTHSNLLENINLSGANVANTLTIKAGDNKAKPWVHHIVIRNSKNIVLDSLAIFSDPADSDKDKDGTQTIGDNAIEMDKNIASGGAGWNTLNTNGYVENANIVVQNCMIGSDGFTGAHISSYDGVTFKNCDFESVFNDPSSNAIAWGASFKLLYCKNIKFIQNNFRGDHATLMWIQEVQNMLVMNNVFWNTNKFTASANQRNPAAMRLVTQWNPVKNVGFYYNTYFFADNGITSTSTYDFMSFAETADINVATVEFKYNNCYSYDKDCPGKSGNPFNGKSLGGNYASNFCPNNFWSQYDADEDNDESVFEFGECENQFINVASQVCSTTASGPASLQIKGQDMNLGIKPDITKTGITLTADEWYSDRYLKDQRPKSNQEWTYGAYQSKQNVLTQYIYWVGISDDWDDRNNWEYEVEDDKTRALVRQRLSCVNTLSPDLIAVIEEKGTVEVTGGRKWPRIPDSFTGTRSNQKDAGGHTVDEHVSAGLGTPTTTWP